MLLSINLLSTELSTFQGELPAAPPLPVDSARPVGRFAELLGQKVLSADLQPQDRFDASQAAAGQALPDDGKALPPDILQESLPERLPELDWTLRTSVDSPSVPTAGLAPVTTALTPTPFAATTGENEYAEPTAFPPRPGAAHEALLRTAQTTVVAPANANAASAPAVSDGRGATMNRERIDTVRPKPTLSGTALRGIDIGAQSLDPPTLDADAEHWLSRPAAGADRVPRQAGDRDEAVRLPLNVPADSRRVAATREPDAARLLATSAQAVDLQRHTSQGPAPTNTATIETLTGIGPTALSPPATSAPAAATNLPRIDVPLPDPAWGDALNERVSIMAGKDIRNAEIRLNPAELGPIRIQLTVDERGTNVNFAAHHALTREAIEQAMPRLRELFADQGLTLGQASVSEQGVKQDRQGFGDDGASRHLADPDATAEEASAQPAIPDRKDRTPSGLVDTFA